jgi:hypothetical protein
MKKNQTNSKYYYIILVVLFANVTNLFAQEIENEKVTPKTDSIASGLKKNSAINKDEKNRNVMLSAESNTQPRQLNIGLPYTGDYTVMEDGVSVVYNFQPSLPIAAWRYDSSIGRIGVASYDETSLVSGKVGYMVDSYGREPGQSFKGFASVYTNSFGSFCYDAAVMGPLNKKGWGYMMSIYENYDRYNGQNYMFTAYQDRTQLFKFGTFKKYKKGYIGLKYKLADYKTILDAYNPFVYEGNGKTKPLDNFSLGRDSYYLGSGIVPYYDAFTGEAGTLQLDDDNNTRSIMHTIYIEGEHEFNHHWKLKYTSMFQSGNSPFNIQYPLSLGVSDPDQQAGTEYYYQGTTNQYVGSVQQVAGQNSPRSEIKTIITRGELTKKLLNHDLRIGVVQQFDRTKYQTNKAVYMQTIEPNPKLLDMYVYDSQTNNYVKYSNQYGALPASAGGYGTVTDYRINKIALYASDEFNVSKWLTLGIGGRIEYANKWDNHDPYVDDFVSGRPLVPNTFNNLWNKVGFANFVANITSDFGVLGGANYNSRQDGYWDYPFKDDLGNPLTDPSTPGAKPLQNVPKTYQTVVENFGVGVFYNKDWLSLVSKVSRISNNNIKSSLEITNPENTTERSTFDPLFYNISTYGWTTDIVVTEKGFKFHYLLTLQNPKYEHYNVSAFGVNYDYNNSVSGLSKVLMEIDPSYSFKIKANAFRVWLSMRYFGKQYANITNSIYWNSWWENFGGIDYRMSRSVEFKLQITNFLNQSGVKGNLQGGDQITDDAKYIGRTMVAQFIRPRTLELTVNFKL